MTDTSTVDPDALLAEILLTPEGKADPYSRYAAIREHSAAFRTGIGFVVVGRFDDCQWVLRDARFVDRCEARHQDRRQRPQRREPPEQFEAGHARQVEVEQREVEALELRHAQGFGGESGRTHFPAVTAEELHEARPQGVVVLDEQYSEALSHSGGAGR